MGTPMTPRKLTRDEVVISLRIEPEEMRLGKSLEDELLDAFPDDGMTPEDVERNVEMRKDIARRVRRGDDWAFGCAVVTVEWSGISAHNSLGRCSYDDGEDFMKDGYYDDMVEETLAELNVTVAAVVARIAPLVEVTEPKLPFAEFVSRATAGIPGAEVGEDNDGQIVIYTGYREMTDNGDFAVRMP